ncbi:hypothetical protein NDN08_000084 [Rhodosorus marinus]|uniref:NADH dehydrogenase [ubiquinone] 1 beta subcomplex subunit 11, mitochondrial n=1 Tax=Rhodosorus marinus TaxID=101924 RepID=A0AAV8UE95_9RHOD|nr:hypothetical protein NDN08_000084 [Rhodosorus marinus]
MSLLRVMKGVPPLLRTGHSRTLHATAARAMGAPAKEGEVFEEEFTDDDEAAPFGEHPDNPNYHEEERRAMPAVIYSSWAAVILVYCLSRRWTPNGSIHVWGEEEFLEREALAMMAQRKEKEDREIEERALAATGP